MIRASVKTRLSQYFIADTTLRRRVFLNQLPIALAVGVCVVIAGAFYPQSFQHPLFMSGLVLNALLLLASFAIPWDRMPRGAFLVIPYLDFLAVGIFRAGNVQFLTAVGLMAFFPVFWLASSGIARKTAIVLSGVGALLTVWVPVLLDPNGLSAEELARPLLFPLIMMGFAVTVVMGTISRDTQRRALERKDVELRALLAASQTHGQLLETVLDAIAVGVVVVDAQGNDRLMNATQKELHQLAIPTDNLDPTEAELLVFGVDAVTPLSAEARPVHRAIMGEAFTNYQLWLGTGEKARAVSTAGRPLLDRQGHFAGAVIAFHDVTEIMNALSAKDSFVARVSHEFRTPLTSIQGYLDLALEESSSLPPDVQKYLAIAVRNTNRLSSLATDLLSADTVTVNPARSDVAQLVTNALATAAPEAAANKVTLHAEVCDGFDAMVDAERIGQVLDNLISNAVKYSPDGGTVTVRAWPDGEDLHAQIQDTGLGMSSEEQLGLFTKFFRARSAVQRSIPGIGLGLMISKTIIAKHGGTLHVASERGVGTTVSFVLPGCVVAGRLTSEALLS